MWLEKGVESDRAKAVVARIRAADTDGLDLNDYKIPDFAAAGPDALAEAELKFTETVLTYARHVQAGRFSYTSVSQNIELPQQPPDITEVLTKMADAQDAGKALDEFSPPQKGYQALKAKLAELRNKSSAANGHEIPDGPELKLAKVPVEDPRVPQLRERLGLKGDAADLRYDAKLADAVKKYQRANELKVTGTLDAPTIRELNGPPRDKQIDTIIVNMERWRWIPRDLGKDYVMVNMPDFTLRLNHNGALLWTTRIVIGKPRNADPAAGRDDEIHHGQSDLERAAVDHSERVPAGSTGRTRPCSSAVGSRWRHERDGTVRIWQPPGDGNALGRLRFNFPNRFDGLPARHAGQVPVQGRAPRLQPRLHAGAGSGQVRRSCCSRSSARTRATRRTGSGGCSATTSRTSSSRAPIPVNITYQTAFVDDDGQLQIRSDVYGLDSRTLALIKTERGMIDVATKERDRDVANAATASARHAVKQPPPGPAPGGFFQALFGGGPPPPVGRPPSRIR